MDCSIMPLKKVKDHFLISTIDFFYPLVENPYQMGKIGAANVLSDMYSMGIDEIDNMLMVLGASREMEEQDRFISTREMMKGFNDHAHTADTEVSGGQSVLNPWPIIGGVAMSVCHKDDFIPPTGLKIGDVLVLTKPLGTQIAVNMRQAFLKKCTTPGLYSNTKDKLTEEQVVKSYEMAAESMEHLNRVGAKLMRKYKSNGATDVTGFGILGHAENLAQAQHEELHIELHSLPIITGMDVVDGILPDLFKLMKGTSAETSGGLLAAFPSEEAAKGFISDLLAEDNIQANIIGSVLPRPEGATGNTAAIRPDVKVIEVDKFYVR
eukprot:TRINITY_DN4904_c1_g1_i1.p1 TRINITY_DN4904_c1_g1~~TRINITY_DN4904_c1_g1_i1.p1  ORF type:complete len:323 (+),score=64.27 TRINITY_DN4904_c1_g1_i1:209-1177(+)